MQVASTREVVGGSGAPTPTTDARQGEARLSAALAEVARMEATGLRPPRLTDPNHDRWRRFAGRLGWAHYIALLFEDLEGAFPILFGGDHWAADLDRLTESQAELLVRRHQAASPLKEQDFLREQASALGLSTTGALSELPVVQPQHRVLELPGAGGRLAAYAFRRDGHQSFSEQFTFVVDSVAQRVLLGLTVAELRANAPTVWTSAEAARRLEQGPAFDRVFGLRSQPPPAWATGLEKVSLV